MPRPRANWQSLTFPPRIDQPVAQTTNDGEVSTLMQWGPQVQFQVWPMNFHEMDHETETAWSKKPIAGGANYREWVGEEDETRVLRGRVFPYRLGGMNELDILDAYRRGGIPNLMVSGDRRSLGWYVMTRFSRYHHALSAEGVGQVIQFEATFVRVPVPEPSEWFGDIWRTQGATPGAAPNVAAPLQAPITGQVPVAPTPWIGSWLRGLLGGG